MQTKKFSLHDFAGGTQLSREEMKNVKGGMAPSGGSGISCSVTNTNTSSNHHLQRYL
ncbi:MAG: hypothetical protein PW786_12860 [Arachidicoccus sp.]|nr:hypothetical protein [Arachidicoccus sp.]